MKNVAFCAAVALIIVLIALFTVRAILRYPGRISIQNASLVQENGPALAPQVSANGRSPAVAPREPEHATQPLASTRTPLARDAHDAKWETAFEKSFSQAKDLEPFTFCFLTAQGDVQFKAPGMLLKNGPKPGAQIYAILHKALPGDLRIRFKVQPPEGEAQVCVATIFNVAGAIRKEDGYFAEWAGGRVKLKKCNHLVADADAPTPPTDSRWVNMEVCKLGGIIALYTDGKKVLEWTDDHPLGDAAHDLFSFYVWEKEARIQDLRIERNAADPVKPLSDDPAAAENAFDGKRTLPPGAVAPTAETNSATPAMPGPTSDF